MLFESSKKKKIVEIVICVLSYKIASVALEQTEIPIQFSPNSLSQYLTKSKMFSFKSIKLFCFAALKTNSGRLNQKIHVFVELTETALHGN